MVDPATPDGIDYYGQFAAIAPALAMLGHLRMAMNIPDERLTLILPPSVLPGVTECYGLTVIRTDVLVPIIGLAPAVPNG